MEFGLKIIIYFFIFTSISFADLYLPLPNPAFRFINEEDLLLKYFPKSHALEYKNKYEFPEGYAELFNKSYDIFMMYRDKLNVDELNVHKSNKDVGGLIKFMVNDIEMDELRVQKVVKKLQNTLGNKI